MEKSSTAWKVTVFITTAIIIIIFLLLWMSVDVAGANPIHNLSLPLVLGVGYPAPPGREPCTERSECVPTPAPTACGPDPKACLPTPTPITIIIGGEP